MMAKLNSSTTQVNPDNSPVIHSEQVNETPRVSFSYDPFAVHLSTRGWLVYAFEAYSSGNGPSIRDIASELGVSVSTIKRGKSEATEKSCLPVVDVDRTNPLVPDDLARLYRRHKLSIPVYFAINRLNSEGQFEIKQDTLAEMVGCSCQSIRRAIGVLDLRSFVQRRHRYQNGKQTTDYLRVRGMAKSERKTPVRHQKRKTASKGSKRVKLVRAEGQTGRGVRTSTSSKYSKSTKGDLYDTPDGVGASPHDPSFISEVKPTHENLIASGDLLDRINQLSPGSRKLDDLRRPKDPFLFVKIYKHKFLNRLLDDYDYAERYRRKFWQNIFRNDPKSAMKVYRVGPVIGQVKDTTTGDMIPVTKELEKLAFLLYSTYRMFVRSRYSMYVRMQLKLKCGTNRYNHFIRFANVVVENRAVRYYRLWMIAQFEKFEDMRESGFVKRKTYPQPNYLCSENAELRFFGYMQTRIEDLEDRVCIDEGMAGKLRRFAQVQRGYALKGKVPPTAEQYFLSEESEMMFMGRELLIRFFGFQVPGA